VEKAHNFKSTVLSELKGILLKTSDKFLNGLSDTRINGMAVICVFCFYFFRGLLYGYRFLEKNFISWLFHRTKHLENRSLIFQMYNFIYNEVFNHKEQNYIICRKIYGTGDHYFEQNKPSSKSQVSQVFVHVWNVGLKW
jgi:hypothetical protein